MLIYTSHLSQGKRFVFIHRFSYTDFQNGECAGKAEKNIQKEVQERAVKELISGNDVSSLHDFEILRLVTYVHLPFSVGSLAFFVASLVFMMGTSCCVFKEEFKVE